MTSKNRMLKQYFGYDHFRDGQEELIDAILAGRDVLGILPTGGGKSICYQLPALLLSGITLVVSPLISLMQDQVMALKEIGVAAAYVNSSLTPSQITRVYANLSLGRYQIVYVAPERLGSEDFLQLCRRLPISLLAVDEAHCISQWGQDFRPSYLHIADFAASLTQRPVIGAFTATATEAVREDILRLLRLNRPHTVLTGFDRPNLTFSVEKGKGRAERLLALMREREGKSGIIYCNSRACVERVCDALIRAGFRATRYHAGLDEEERSRNQQEFLYDHSRIMVATNAFGMGIDKSNVSFVIHYNLPLSLEAYYQEAGRAGRDGAEAECILFFSESDIHTARMLLENGNENEGLSEEERRSRLQINLSRLGRMVDYCRTTDCLRGAILSYFGQPHPPKCDKCGNCQSSFRKIDRTVEAQMVLSCVARIKGYLGYSVGKQLLSGVLVAGRDHRIADLGLDTLSTYGVMKGWKGTAVRELIEQLRMQGYLLQSEFGAYELSEEALPLLRGERSFHMLCREEGEAKTGKSKRAERRRADRRGDVSLFDALRALRAEIAASEHLPQYIIFSNATLSDMALKRPHDLGALLGVSGVGEKKAERYGARFLAAIARWEKEQE